MSVHTNTRRDEITMFKLEQNDFLNAGKAVYKDEYCNELRMTRTSDGFRAKLRFKHPGVYLDVIEIKVPVKGASGVNVNIRYEGKPCADEPDVKDGISGLSDMLSRWIAMIGDIECIDCPNELLLKLNPGKTMEDCINHKLSYIGGLIEEYEELEGLKEAIMGKNVAKKIGGIIK